MIVFARTFAWLLTIGCAGCVSSTPQIRYYETTGIAESTDADSSTGDPWLLCGNGELDDGEECDDGNLNPHDACTHHCAAAFCGDGITRTGVEQCDEGPGNANSARCTVTCTLPPPFCGDFEIEGDEGCDFGPIDKIFSNKNMKCTGQGSQPPCQYRCRQKDSETMWVVCEEQGHTIENQGCQCEAPVEPT